MGNKTSSDETSNANKDAARLTLPGLNSHIDKLDARLKRADTITRKSVKVLEAACEDLVSRLGTQEILTRDLAADVRVLTDNFSDRLDVATQDVKSDLSAALHTGDVDEIASAVSAAHERLNGVETYHNQTVAAVNSRIARLASIIDSRLQTEARERELLTQKAQEKFVEVDDRLDAIEADTAKAVKSIGDRVVTLSDSLQAQSHESTAGLHKDLEAALLEVRAATQKIEGQSPVQAGGLPDSVSQDIADIRGSLSRLTVRLTALEHRETSPALPVQNRELSDETHDQSAARMALAGGAAARYAAPSYNPVAPSPAPIAEPAPAALTPPPEAVPTVEAGSNILPYTPGQGPMEYDPSLFADEPNPWESRTQVPDSPAGQMPTVQAGAPVTPLTTAPLNVPPPFTAPNTDLPPPNPDAPIADFMSAPNFDDGLDDDADITPLSSELNMDAARPGFGTETKSKGLLSPRNLKVAGYALLISTAGLMAGKALIGGKAEAPHQSAAERSESIRAQSNGTAAQTDRQARAEAGYSAGGESQAAPNMAPLGSANMGNAPAMNSPEGLGADPQQTAPVTLADAAASGDAIAQFQMGMMRLSEGNTAEGVRLIRLSANQNQPAAQFRLAKLYETGQGVTADEAMARKLLEKSANGGNAIAMHELGLYHANGVGGLTSDMKAATAWFDKAAQYGVIHSAFNMALLSETGDGVPQSLTDSYVWFGISAKLGDAEAVQQMERLKANLAPEDLARAEGRINRYTPLMLDEAANGIFRNVAWAADIAAAPRPAAPAPGPEIIKDVQIMLNRLGYDAGTEDGAMGPKTREAISAFEENAGKAPSGQINPQLYNQLKSAVGA